MSKESITKFVYRVEDGLRLQEEYLDKQLISTTIRNLKGKIYSIKDNNQEKNYHYQTIGDKEYITITTIRKNGRRDTSHKITSKLTGNELMLLSGTLAKVYVYNEQNLLIETQTGLSMEIYEYDDKNKLIETKNYEKDIYGQLVFKPQFSYKYKHVDNTKIIEKYDGTRLFKHNYDEKNRLIQSTTDSEVKKYTYCGDTDEIDTIVTIKK